MKVGQHWRYSSSSTIDSDDDGVNDDEDAFPNDASETLMMVWEIILMHFRTTLQKQLIVTMMV